MVPKGYKQPEESRQKMREAALNRSDETRRKMSEAAKRYWEAHPEPRSRRMERSSPPGELRYEGDTPVVLSADEFRQLLSYFNVLALAIKKWELKQRQGAQAA